MKLKIVLMAAAATLALGYQAQASIGTVTNYDKINFSIVVTTNKPYVYKNDVYIYPVGTAKFGNKDLLNLIQSPQWANTTFPTGAQLVVGWDSEWDGDVLVVDKTGTNVLLDVTTETNHSYVEVYLDEYDGAYSETYKDTDPGFDTWSETYASYFVLYDSNIDLDLWAEYPTGKQHFTQNWDKNGNYSTWTDNEVISLSFGGDQELDDNTSASLSGTAVLAGHGKGYNPYWY